MKVEMLMPQMGESIAEATVLKWLKNVGEQVAKDETILEISTDKVDSEIPAPESGVLVDIKASEGDTVAVKSIIAVIDTEAAPGTSEASSGAAAPSSGASDSPEPASAPQAASATPASSPSEAGISTSSNGAQFSRPEPVLIDGAEQTHALSVTGVSTPSVSGTSAESSSEPNDGRYYSPLVKSLAKQHSVSGAELASINGTGSGGRVSKKDFLNFLENRPAAGNAAQAAPQASQPAAAPSSSSAPSSIQAPAAGQTFNADGIKVEPMSRMRQLIADHMVMSKKTSPHVYSVAEIDVTNIGLARKKNQAAFVAREGFKLSYTPFFLMAATRALVQYPGLNASVDGKNVLIKKDVNLGVAVALGTTGLIVPVIKKADQLSLAGIARSLNDLADRARNKKLKPEDTQGGTFTVTNPGIFGNIIGCPIINQPQVGILATCAIKKRPVVVNNMIAIRDIIYLTLSYDHRVVDGSLSGMFLKYVTDFLEGWDPNEEII